VCWHRETQRESKFKWWDIDVMMIVTANNRDLTSLENRCAG